MDEYNADDNILMKEVRNCVDLEMFVRWLNESDTNYVEENGEDVYIEGDVVNSRDHEQCFSF